MTSHTKKIIKQQLEQNIIVRSHQLYPQDPVTGEVTLDITLNARTAPAANDVLYDSFTRNVSDLLFDKVNEAAHMTPNEVWLHDDTSTPQPVISFTFSAEDWTTASRHQDDITTMLDSLESPRNLHPHTYFENIAEQVKQRISDTAQPTNEAFFTSLADGEAVAKKLGDLNMRNVKLEGHGYNSIIMTPENNDDFVIRITAEDRQKMHHIPQVLNPVFRDVIADNLWIEVLPKIRIHGVTDNHKNAMKNALEAQGLTLEQDDIGLLALVDGTQLPISYDTTNIARLNQHSEQWDWQKDNVQQPYDWESPAFEQTMTAYQEKFDAHERDGSINMDKNLRNAEKVNVFAKAANEPTHADDLYTSRHNSSNDDVVGF